MTFLKATGGDADLMTLQREGVWIMKVGPAGEITFNLDELTVAEAARRVIDLIHEVAGVDRLIGPIPAEFRDRYQTDPTFHAIVHHLRQADTLERVCKILSVFLEGGVDALEFRAALAPFAAMADTLAGAPADKLLSNPRIHTPLYARDFYEARRVLAIPVKVDP